MLMMTSYLVTRATDRHQFFFPKRFPSILKNTFLAQKSLETQMENRVEGFFPFDMFATVFEVSLICPLVKQFWVLPFFLCNLSEFWGDPSKWIKGHRDDFYRGFSGWFQSFPCIAGSPFWQIAVDNISQRLPLYGAFCLSVMVTFFSWRFSFVWIAVDTISRC